MQSRALFSACALVVVYRHVQFISFFLKICYISFGIYISAISAKQMKVRVKFQVIFGLLLLQVYGHNTQRFLPAMYAFRYAQEICSYFLVIVSLSVEVGSTGMYVVSKSTLTHRLSSMKEM